MADDLANATPPRLTLTLLAMAPGTQPIVDDQTLTMTLRLTFSLNISLPSFAVTTLALTLQCGCQTPVPQPLLPGQTPASAEPSSALAPPKAYALEASGPEELVRLGLQHHPGVQATEARVRRMRAKVHQITALPDPRVKFSGGSMAETAAGRAEFVAAFEQGVPFPGKRREEAGAAAREAAAAAADLQALRLQVAQRIRQAYWDYFLATQSGDIMEESRSVMELVRNIIDARVAADQASQGDQLRLATELGSVEEAIIVARQREDSAKAMLNALLNRPADASIPRPGSHAVAHGGELDRLLAQAEMDHPNVAEAQAQIEAFRHRLNRAKLDLYPDFTLGLQQVHVSRSGLAPSANGRDQIFATLGIDLPLWRQPRQAKIEEASAGLHEAEANLAAVRADLRFRLRDAWVRARSSRDLIALFRDRIIPESKQAFDLSLQSYAAEQLTFADVLDTWRQWLGYQLQQARNRAALGKATAALRSASGEL